MKKTVSIIAGTVFIAGVASFTITGLDAVPKDDIKIFTDKTTSLKQNIAGEPDGPGKDADIEALFATQKLYDDVQAQLK